MFEEFTKTTRWTYFVLDKRYPKKFIDPVQKVKIETFQNRMKSAIKTGKKIENF